MSKDGIDHGAEEIRQRAAKQKLEAEDHFHRQAFTMVYPKIGDTITITVKRATSLANLANK